MSKFPLYDLSRNKFDKLATTVIGKCAIVKHSTDLRLFLFTRNLAWNVVMSKKSLDEEAKVDADQNNTPPPKARISRKRGTDRNSTEEPQPKVAKLSKQKKTPSRNADGHNHHFQSPRHKNSTK